jgi:eukaryotic-like serine/threonine-protein kinase
VALTPGTRVGPYEVTALIGEGGMGKVWRAHHTALNRDDALKVLPEAFASDPDRLARFRREAQVLASLNHANIAHVYGLEQADGVQALVMELVEGETLADRIARGPIPVDEALPIAKQVAEALQAAHEQGIIHRDLKPANIKVRDDGTVKVLDFGLAKLAEANSSKLPSALSMSPTITSPALVSGVGVVLGTAAYMSPEQAKGKPADKRSDVWAFACVVYEMLTGKRCFDGEDVADALAFVLTKEPDWGALPPGTPPLIANLLRRCLEKDRRKRAADIAASLFAIDEVERIGTSDRLTVTRLGSVENAYSVFLSPDGKWVGFIDQLSGGSLKKIAITGGPVITIGRLPPAMGASGGSWSADGTIVLGSGAPNGGGLWRVNEAGGTPEALTTANPQRGEGRHGSPEILPGGQAILFASVPTNNRSEEARIEVLNLTTGERKTLIQGGNHPHYLASGHVLYQVEDTLRAVRFDLNRLTVIGNPVPVAEGLATSSYEGTFSVAPNGTLVYLQGVSGASATRTLVWMDRQGREETIPVPPRAYAGARLSPDGTRVALEVSDENTNIWIWHLVRQTLTRLTFDAEGTFGGIWSPDGQRLAFSRIADGDNIYWQAADGTGIPERLTQRSKFQRPIAFAPDATALLFHEPPAGVKDIGIVRLSGDRKSELILHSPFDEANAEISPDGRWLVYQSNESGRAEIYVRPFPDVGSGRWQISTDGGTRPVWARTGRELFYYIPPGTIMAVPIELRPSFDAGTPRALFTADYPAQLAHRPYDVSPDGQRFLMIKAVSGEAAPPPQLVVVQHFDDELRRLVPTR